MFAHYIKEQVKEQVICMNNHLRQAAQNKSFFVILLQHIRKEGVTGSLPPFSGKLDILFHFAGKLLLNYQAAPVLYAAIIIMALAIGRRRYYGLQAG